ncbi:LuxR C-terminal-related transcriptional regulator [Marinobacterium maritimum]|uniref:LuxR C-terminal-related transcriptional regulator n=1 Tax=Marinobacterium maritimum TaxID=500162 RepID=A0ABP3TGA3_9GAMM
MTGSKQQLDYEGVAQLVLELGGPVFSEELLCWLNNICEINHLSLVHLEEQDKVTYILSASDKTLNITPEMQQLYLTIYYRLDPNKEFLQDFTEDDQMIIRRLRQQDINDLGYRRLWYDKMGIVDRLSVIVKADKGLYCLNLFRNKTPFPDTAIDAIHRMASLLSSLIIKHSRLSGSLSSFMTREAQIEMLIKRLSKLDSSLSQREKEVCSRVLLGMSSDGIALDLGIKLQSVLTYRKRAYSRLNISSQNELFGLCLTVS